MKNLFGAGATAFLTCLDMAVKSEVEKWPDEEEKPFADSKKIVLRKVHNKGMCMSLLKEYPQFVKYTSLVMAAILTVWDILCQLLVRCLKPDIIHHISPHPAIQCVAPRTCHTK